MTPLLRTFAAHAARLDEMRKGRERIRAVFGDSLTVPVIKQLDDQAVVGLLAIDKALQRAHADTAAWHDWGTVGCPRRPGRLRIAEALQRYSLEGARSVSPYLTPHYSLHSISGIISQVLKTHGPNLGVGGVPGTEPHALWTAVALLEEGVAGVWIVWTCWDEEPTLDHQPPDLTCRAVAVAIARSETPRPVNGSATAFPPASIPADGFTFDQLYAWASQAAARNGSVVALPGLLVQPS